MHPLDLHSFPTRRSSDLDDADRQSVPLRVEGVDRVLEDGRVAGVVLRHRDDEPVEALDLLRPGDGAGQDRKSTRLNSSHVAISYAVFCLKKKKHERVLEY